MDVVLRPVEDDDLPRFFEMFRDPESVAMAGVPARDPEAFHAHWAKIRADPLIVLRTVTADGEVVGNVLCFPRDGRQELGYWVAREHWGRGIASAAVRAFLAEYPARPLAAGILESNLGSLRVIARSGFVEMSREDGFVTLRLD